MDRLFGLFAIGMGVFAVVARERFVRGSLDTSRNVFGRDVRPGTREHAFMTRFTRVWVTLCGTVLVMLGTLGLLGVIWQD